MSLEQSCNFHSHFRYGHLLLVFIDSSAIQDMVSLGWDNLQRPFMYIDKLLLLVLLLLVCEKIFTIYDAHVK
jgi:hypothetical protein